MKLRSFQLLVNDQGQIIMGKGRMDILQTIHKTGSINKAAKALDMSYKSVWSKIKSTEKHFGQPVVHADRVTGTRLTREGLALLDKYRQLNQACQDADDAIFEAVFHGQTET